MTLEIVTKEDLISFRQQLLEDLKALLPTNATPNKQWLKSSEVRRLLNISAGTLQTLRISGRLSYTKLGGIIYYNYDDIQAVLENKNYQAARNNNLLIDQNKKVLL